MFKYKRMALYVLLFLYLILSFIELMKYMFVNSNVFGLTYLIINLVIIFLLIPTTYNYRKYFSKIRISKLILIILIGIFNSFVLQGILLNNVGFTDESKRYIESIFVIKNIFKPILFFILGLITILEFKVRKLFDKKINN